MTAPEPRIVPPAEARAVLPGAQHTARQSWERMLQRNRIADDLAHTAAVLGEQREAVLALHVKACGYWADWKCEHCSDEDSRSESSWPCPTARALGVTS